MDPFIAVMRRYVVDYTNRQDASVCAELMDEGYTLRMGPHVLSGRDEHYVPAARRQFEQFPGLGLTVHEIATNGTDLVMRFSEHGASLRHGGARAAWSGIGLYLWDGSRLLENYVEQDYLSRQRQLRSGPPAAVAPPASAPWDTEPQPAEPAAEEAVRQWVRAGLPGSSVQHDDGSAGPRLDVSDVRIDRLFSAGPSVAVRASVDGSYLGGLPELDDRDAQGRPATLHLVGLVQVSEGGRVSSGHVVSDRLGFIRSLEQGVAEQGAT